MACVPTRVQLPCNYLHALIPGLLFFRVATLAWQTPCTPWSPSTLLPQETQATVGRYDSVDQTVWIDQQARWFHEDDEEEEKFCFCGKDIDAYGGLMIQCDTCDEW